jgi:hypothetical protein
MLPENDFPSKIDHLLGAVRQNPAMKKLTMHCLKTPQSIQDFLTGDATLNTFKLLIQPATARDVPLAVAKSIAASLKGNKKLREIVLFVRTCHLDTIIAGLCHNRHHEDNGDSSLSSSCLELLTLWTDQPESNPFFGRNVLEAIKCNPCLKRLTVNGLSARPSYYAATFHRPATAQPWVDCDASWYDQNFYRQYNSDQSQQICDAFVRVFQVN